MGRTRKPIVLLPYCVEKRGKLKKLAEKEGFRAEILRHDNEVPRILEKYKPSYVLGVACPPIIAKVGKYVKSIGLKGESIPVKCQTCMKITGKRTKIDEQKYIRALKRLKKREKRKLK